MWFASSIYNKGIFHPQNNTNYLRIFFVAFFPLRVIFCRFLVIGEVETASEITRIVLIFLSSFKDGELVFCTVVCFDSIPRRLRRRFHHLDDCLNVSAFQKLLVPLIVLVVCSLYCLCNSFPLYLFLALVEHSVREVSQQILAIDKRNNL